MVGTDQCFTLLYRKSIQCVCIYIYFPLNANKYVECTYIYDIYGMQRERKRAVSNANYLLVQTSLQLPANS